MTGFRGNDVKESQAAPCMSFHREWARAETVEMFHNPGGKRAALARIR